jgi:integrase
MAVVRVKGIKRFKEPKTGRWYTYHRKTGIRIKSEIGTPAFFVELAAIEQKSSEDVTQPGTLGGLLKAYRQSSAFTDLADATQRGYTRMIDILRPIDRMPHAELTPAFIARLRDSISQKRGRRTANYVMAVISVACEHGRERGLLLANPVRGVKRKRRDREAPRANRPWSRDEMRVVLDEAPPGLRVPIAIAMYTGLRKGDILSLTKASLRGDRLVLSTGKTRAELRLPIHTELRRLLADGPAHDAITICASRYGTPWTIDGFNSSFIKFIAKLLAQGRVGKGLTFHGLRHTVGTLLAEAGGSLDLIRRVLGQRTLAMAQHYTETASLDKATRGLIDGFDPLGNKSGM